MDSNNLRLFAVLVLAVGAEFLFVLGILTPLGGAFGLMVIFVTLLVGAGLFFSLKGEGQRLLYLLLLYFISFKIAPDIENTNLKELVGSVFLKNDSISGANVIYCATAVSCIFQIIQKRATAAFSVVIVSCCLLFRYLSSHDLGFVSLYQELYDFVIVSCALSLFLYLRKVSISFEKSEVLFAFRLLVAFAFIEIVSCLFPTTWSVSFRGGFSGFFSGTETSLSLLIVFAIMIIHNNITSTWIKSVLLFITYPALFLTHNKTAFILAVVMPLIPWLTRTLPKAKKLLLVSGVLSIFCFYYLLAESKELASSIASRLASVLAPMPLFLEHMVGGIGPAITFDRGVPSYSLRTFSSDFKWIFDLMELDSETIFYFINIQPGVSDELPIQTHIGMLALIYTMGALGVYISYQIYVKYISNFYNLTSSTVPLVRTAGIIGFTITILTFFHPIFIFIQLIILASIAQSLAKSSLPVRYVN